MYLFSTPGPFTDINTREEAESFHNREAHITEHLHASLKEIYQIYFKILKVVQPSINKEEYKKTYICNPLYDEGAAMERSLGWVSSKAK